MDHVPGMLIGSTALYAHQTTAVLAQQKDVICAPTFGGRGQRLLSGMQILGYREEGTLQTLPTALVAEALPVGLLLTVKRHGAETSVGSAGNRDR